MIADKDYFLDKDRQLTDDEAKAAFLLVRKGQEISKKMADDYGIGKVAQPEDEAEKPVKKAAKSTDNKAEKAPDNKSAK